MLFNVNHKVRVRLTDEGRQIIARKEEAFAELLGRQASSMVKEIDGWSEWQMWELMKEFGPHLFNGCKVPFETEIEIIENQK